jgi:hypothetical protein
MRCRMNGLGQWVVTLDLDEMQRIHAALVCSARPICWAHEDEKNTTALAQAFETALASRAPAKQE